MIFVSSSSFRGNERKYVLDCLDRQWLTQGAYVRRFEEAFADRVGTTHALACSSGTTALHLALLALGVDPATTVIVPALTYVATANAASYCGADVAFADIDPHSWCMDLDYASSLFADLTEDPPFYSSEDIVTVPVHLFDARAPVPPLGLVVEDAAQCIGSTRSLAAYSFYGSKVITTGEGGMVTTDDDDIAEAVRLYRGQGAPIPGRYYHKLVGYNYRMTDLQAAVGLAQLETLDTTLATRRDIINRYRDNLSNTTVTLQGGKRASGWAMAVLLPPDCDRDSVAVDLARDHIETRPFFEPINTLPPYSPNYFHPTPVATDVASRGLVLPTHVELTTSDIDYVCSRLLARTSQGVANAAASV